MTRVVGALTLGTALRRLPWTSVAAALVAGGVVLWAAAARAAPDPDLTSEARIAIVLLAAAAATCVEDGAEEVSAVTPFGRRRRRIVSVLLMLTVSVASWLVLAIVVRVVAPSAARGVRIGGLTSELVALSLVACAFGAVLIAFNGRTGSAAWAAISFVAVVATTVAQPDVRSWLWTDVGSVAWWLIGAIGVGAFGAASRDPVTR